MVAVLEVEAEGDVDAVLEEDIADGTVDDVVDGPGLHKRQSNLRYIQRWTSTDLAGNKPDLEHTNYVNFDSCISVLIATWFGAIIYCIPVRLSPHNARRSPHSKLYLIFAKDFVVLLTS